jgi:cation diffusion facilitator CzcD-associated flavoprotein CzcO
LKQLADKRVVVVGAGNSAADIVVDATGVSRRIYLSMRRGTFFVPKFLFGRPMDGIINFIENVPLPRWLRNRLYTHWHRLMVGKNERYGLPEPEHRIMDTHPTMNTALPQLCAHGRIGVKPEIIAFDGHKVRFKDGSNVEADLVVFATGYEIAIPFLDEDMIFDADGRPHLYLNVFHPEHDDFFAVGLIQANGSIWRLADLQSQLVASFLVAQAEGHERAEWMRKLKKQGWTSLDHADYVQSARHRLEANYYDYRRALKRHLRRFGKLAGRQMPPGGLSTRSAPAATKIARHA